MLSTHWATVKDGHVELLQPTVLPEGAQLLVTVVSDSDLAFWQAASSSSLDQVWDNSEDDRYAELLAR